MEQIQNSHQFEDKENISDGEVKGPYDAADWRTMLEIRRSLKYLKSLKPSPKRGIAIRWQEGKFKKEINKAA